MSGDVQPRKRKDKRRKKDDSDEGPSIPAKSNVSHAAPQLSDGDSIIHVHHEGGTGGHWCAKIIFFVLLGLLVGLIGLIILENRGLTDLDTPVAESRYAQVFDGWVDEGPAHDDHHDEHTLELKHGDDEHDDDDDDDDHDENDDDIEDIEHEVHDDEDDDHAEESDEAEGQDEDVDHDDNDENDLDDDNDDPQDSAQDDNDDESGENDNEQDVEDQYNEIDYDGEGDNDDGYLNTSPVDDDDDNNEDDVDDVDDDDDDDDDYLNASPEKKDLDDENDDGDDINDDNDDNDDDDDNEKADSQENNSNINNSYEDEKDQPFEEVDSVEEEVIDNYAGEEEHLAAKRAEQLAQEQDQESTGRAKPTSGNALDDSDSEDWAGEPDDRWKEQLDLAQAEMDEGRVEEAFRIFTAMSLTRPLCPLAKLGRAKALDSLAETKRSNGILQSAITAYKDILEMKIHSDLFRSVANRTIALMRFRGRHLDAVPVHKMLIEKYPSNPNYRNQLAITYLMINKVNKSRNVLSETLRLWPHDGVALVHYGFILKTVDNNLAESVIYMQEGINTGAEGTLEGRFLFHLGDALARLGNNDKARKIYELGASIGVFLSRDQRSLYNVNHLTGRPWWKPEETPYANLVAKLEANWKKIAREAKQLRTQFKPEQENLKDTGDWSQYELFVRGREVKDHCARCPITCGLIHLETAASGCRRGQVKFSAMSPSTHVFAHTGPTNCRLRAHLGLEGTDNTFLRVSQEIRSWEKGKIFIFDDSFEHEVWHNGSALRIVLIVDLWHPELTMKERASLPAI